MVDITLAWNDRIVAVEIDPSDGCSFITAPTDGDARIDGNCSRNRRFHGDRRSGKIVNLSRDLPSASSRLSIPYRTQPRYSLHKCARRSIELRRYARQIFALHPVELLDLAGYRSTIHLAEMRDDINES